MFLLFTYPLADKYVKKYIVNESRTDFRFRFQIKFIGLWSNAFMLFTYQYKLGQVDEFPVLMLKNLTGFFS